MKVILSKTGYEQLIKQLIIVEENINDITNVIIQNGIFHTKSEGLQFFKKYIRKVETLFEELEVVKDMDFRSRTKANLLPFIVLGCHFTLCDETERRYYCHVCSDNTWDRKSPYIPIYYLSKSGINLLSKETGESVYVDIGNGMKEYTINSIMII